VNAITQIGDQGSEGVKDRFQCGLCSFVGGPLDGARHWIFDLVDNSVWHVQKNGKYVWARYARNKIEKGIFNFESSRQVR
jgi:hypothetical protein